MRRRTFMQALAATPIGFWLAKVVNAGPAPSATSESQLTCSRCGQKAKITLRTVRETWFTPSQSDFNAAQPVVMHVCASCITDDELAQRPEVAAVILFTTDVWSRRSPDNAKHFEHARSLCQTRHNLSEDEEHAQRRRYALKAVGL